MLDQSMFEWILPLLLLLFRRDKSEFWSQLITIDKSWVHQYTPKTKLQKKNSELQGEKQLQKEQNCFFGWKSDGDYFLG